MAIKIMLAILLLLSLTPSDAWATLNGHWKLQDNAANITVVATVGTNGTLANAGNTSANTTTGPGNLLPAAINFSTSNDYVDVTTGNSGIIQNKAVVTLAAWVNAGAGTGDRGIITALNGSSTTRAEIAFTSTGFIRAGGRAGDGESPQLVTTTAEYDDGAWHHVMAVINYATDTITIYVDGSSVATTGTPSFTGTATGNTASPFILLGNRAGGASAALLGIAADARIYDSDESANVSTIMADGVDVVAPSITTSATQSLEESERDVVTVAATDGTTPYVWSITGGADQALFSINSSTGALTMPGSADYENPEDADTNNVYVVEVTCTDDDTETDALTINVTVTDEGGAGTGFSAGVNNGPIR